MLEYSEVPILLLYIISFIYTNKSVVLTATIQLGTRIYAKNILCDTHALRSLWDFDPIPYHLTQNEAKGLIISIGTGTLNQFKVAQPWATRPPDGWHNIFRIVKYPIKPHAKLVLKSYQSGVINLVLPELWRQIKTLWRRWYNIVSVQSWDAPIASYVV